VDQPHKIKDLLWIGSSRKDLRAFPDEVKDVMGYALYQAQIGLKAPSAKTLAGFGSAGVLEIVDDHQTDTYRAIYTVRFSDSVYVLHAFQKKSRTGTATPRTDIELIKKRLKVAEEHYSSRLSERERTMKARSKTSKRGKLKASGVRVEASSGNVFSDLDLENSEELLLKAKLATEIAQLIEKKGWTQSQTAERIDLDQPKVSRLLRGQLSGFSADRLFAILNRLGHSVEVRISAKERPPEESHTRVMIG
jgi:phage-related protein/predicted XRE-type DNA-binding protein